MNTSATYANALLAVHQSLAQLARWQCRGFDCSQAGLAALERWTGSDSVRSIVSDVSDVSDVSETPISLDHIRAELDDCRCCSLSKSRSQIVFGEGDAAADLIFVDAFPGPADDQQGKPFTGPAGELLTRIIEAMKMTREKVYLCHLIKCIPPEGQRPDGTHFQTCLPFFQKQLNIIQPKVICTLGPLAPQILLNTSTSLDRLRGRFYDYEGIKMMPTLHPTDLLAHPERKRLVWDDVKKIMAYLRIPL